MRAIRHESYSFGGLKVDQILKLKGASFCVITWGCQILAGGNSQHAHMPRAVGEVLPHPCQRNVWLPKKGMCSSQPVEEVQGAEIRF